MDNKKIERSEVALEGDEELGSVLSAGIDGIYVYQESGGNMVRGLSKGRELGGYSGRCGTVSANSRGDTLRCTKI